MKQKKTIIIVDDDPVNCTVLQRQLEPDFKVCAMPSGHRAMAILSNSPCDLLFLSHCLSDSDGLKVLCTIRMRHSTLPIIFMSAETSTDFVISVFRSGAQDFLKLPLNLDEVLQSVRRIFGDSDHSSAHDGMILESATIESAIQAQSKQVRNVGSSQGGKKARSHHLSRLDGLFERLVKKRSKPDKLADDLKINPSENNCLRESRLSPNRGASSGNSDLEIPRGYIEIESEKRAAQLFPLDVFFLGKFRIIVGDRLVDEWPTHKAKEILAFLLYYRHRPIYRDVLMDKFWPNSSSDSARNCLNVTLHSIRSLLQKYCPSIEHIIFKDACYSINPDLAIKVDVEVFTRYWQRGLALEREQHPELALAEYELAASLYKGDFMEEDLYESWNELDRENYKETYLTILDKLSHYYSMNGKPEVVIDLCHQILNRDNCREDIYRRLMKSYCRIGKREKALKEYQKCVQILQKEFGTSPTQQTIQLFERLRQI